MSDLWTLCNSEMKAKGFYQETRRNNEGTWIECTYYTVIPTEKSVMRRYILLYQDVKAINTACITLQDCLNGEIKPIKTISDLPDE